MGSKRERLVLAADIGGTRARLLLARIDADGWRPVRRQETANAAHAGVEALIESFLDADASEEKPFAACLAVAGVLHGQCMRMTNLPWAVDGERLRERFGFSRVRLINDFAAQAHGLASLGVGGLLTLAPGEPEDDGVRALIGAGTGLGMAVLAGALQHPVVFPSQGGLADFAPRGARELALCEALMTRYGRVSIEMLLSGHGIGRIHRFVAGLPPEDPAAPDAAAIAAAALAGEGAAIETLRLFARILAAAAANFALTVLARGGVYLTGGIVPRILPFLHKPEIVEVFRTHPSMGEALSRIPLHAVCDEHLGLGGAARIAAGLARDEA